MAIHVRSLPAEGKGRDHRSGSHVLRAVDWHDHLSDVINLGLVEIEQASARITSRFVPKPSTGRFCRAGLIRSKASPREADCSRRARSPHTHLNQGLAPRLVSQEVVGKICKKSCNAVGLCRIMHQLPSNSTDRPEHVWFQCMRSRDRRFRSTSSYHRSVYST